MTGTSGRAGAVARRAVVAIGGNALILDGQRGTIAEQYDNAVEMARHIATLVAAGWGVVLTHGNGPQVGFILLRSELVGDSAPVPALSLEMSSADSQGGIGHILAMALLNELAARGLPDRVAYVLTHTVVDPDDPAFAEPTKPIGPFYDAEGATAKERGSGWTMIEDSGRGYRRVVPSPKPLRIVESAQIRSLVDAGFVVVAVGGGGIPVVETPRGYEGVEAVIDKDRASALLAASLEVPLLVLSTGVEQVAWHFRQPDQRLIASMTAEEATRYLDEGEFPKGSMGPKIEAAVDFLGHGGDEVLITTPAALERAINGETGTRIVPSRVASPVGRL
ncbi:MAG TPA: carbamate kinase [Candidatus Limnocylindrales bacterium]|nr:carbamate kinase [Candidatus Limnocylindrales bacterium]